MPAPFSILALDLHNTVYDEVMEYGLAIDEAVTFFIDLATQHGLTLTREALYKELAAAHRQLGSDWDSEVWHLLPSLKNLPLNKNGFAGAADQAEALRRVKSRELMTAGLYRGLHETLAALKKRGTRIFVVTEAAADMAIQAAEWLSLEGLIDGIYSYPSTRMPVVPQCFYHEPFPPSPEGGHLKKPHPYLLAAILIAEGVRQSFIPEGTKLETVFTLSESAFDLVIRDTPHASIIRKLQGEMLYVGDSKFKDGMLARHAGVAFGFAAYGKKIRPGDEALHAKSLEIMYAVTGWDQETLKLTQESGRSEMVDRLQPDYTFSESLSEALPLFIS